MGTLHCDDIFLVNNNCRKTPPKDDVSATNWEGQKAAVDQTVSRVDHIFLRRLLHFLADSFPEPGDECDVFGEIFHGLMGGYLCVEEG